VAGNLELTVVEDHPVEAGVVDGSGWEELAQILE
jgi:hypothetical protein